MRATTTPGTEDSRGRIASPIVAATIAVLVASATYPVGAGAVDDPREPGGEAAASSIDVPAAIGEAVDEDRPHVVAFGGIVALAVLGGTLIARNRLAGGGAAAPREEVVTDRERVHRLLVDHGGRMRQSEIVDSVEWSKAKVSRLLADLEADGEITKLRLGRENLICLSGHEPRASRPPHVPDP